MKRIVFIISFFGLVFPLYAQTGTISGTVSELNDEQEKQALEFVNVYWSGTSQGTITDSLGSFTLNIPEEPNRKLIISFVGYTNDTLVLEEDQTELDIVLASAEQLDEVTITKRLGGSYISKLEPIKTEVITVAGLQQLPCCNLSESFENSATIDVGFSDAVTGAKHIKMLGLAGVYSQLMFENIPFLRGLESSFGLNYVPGPWLESIQISKGAAAVINGYESTTGQINLEYLKPENSDPIFLNLFGNSKGRIEGNLASALKINDKWSTMLLAHASAMQQKIDRNGDAFLDVPMNKQVNLFNRWKYNPEGDLRIQFGINVMNEVREGGQMDFDYDLDAPTQNSYGINVEARKYHAYGKIGKLFPDKPYQSIGLQASGTLFTQEGLFGRRNYTGEQKSFYANLIFQSIISNTNHTYNLGASFQYDSYDEVLDMNAYSRTERTPGVFGQYTYTSPDKMNAIAGFRADLNNIYGLLLTPRIHFRYLINDQTNIRASVGKAYRSANALSEHLGLIASSRQFNFPEEFDIEQAWNYGINATRHFPVAGDREVTLSLDAYRTDFQNQVIVDVDRDPSQVYFYNLRGRSYSNNFQAQLDAEPIERFDLTLAYRFSDVKSTINQELKEVPLTSRYKGLLTLSYATWYDIWSFDLTTQLNGQNRLPDTRMKPIEYRRDDFSPAYVIIHAQVTRRFRHFDVYAGAENLTDFTQDDPIIAPDDPFGEHFDASMVWGPLLGRRFYAGIRITLD